MSTAETLPAVSLPPFDCNVYGGDDDDLDFVLTLDFDVNDSNGLEACTTIVPGCLDTQSPVPNPLLHNTIEGYTVPAAVSQPDVPGDNDVSAPICVSPAASVSPDEKSVSSVIENDTPPESMHSKLNKIQDSVPIMDFGSKFSPMTTISSNQLIPTVSDNDLSSKRSAGSKRRRSTSNISAQSEEAAEQERRARNREHARRSRLRKKSLTNTLKQSFEELKEENEKLRNQIYAMFSKKETDAMVKARISSPAEKFIENLKKPENTVVDNETLAFLQALRTKSPPMKATAVIG